MYPTAKTPGYPEGRGVACGIGTPPRHGGGMPRWSGARTRCAAATARPPPVGLRGSCLQGRTSVPVSAVDDAPARPRTHHQGTGPPGPRGSLWHITPRRDPTGRNGRSPGDGRTWVGWWCATAPRAPGRRFQLAWGLVVIASRNALPGMPTNPPRVLGRKRRGDKNVSMRSRSRKPPGGTYRAAS